VRPIDWIYAAFFALGISMCVWTTITGKPEVPKTVRRPGEHTEARRREATQRLRPAGVPVLPKPLLGPDDVQRLP
jgi:hypothetical protein